MTNALASTVAARCAAILCPTCSKPMTPGGMQLLAAIPNMRNGEEFQVARCGDHPGESVLVHDETGDAIGKLSAHVAETTPSAFVVLDMESRRGRNGVSYTAIIGDRATRTPQFCGEDEGNGGCCRYYALPKSDEDRAALDVKLDAFKADALAHATVIARGLGFVPTYEVSDLWLAVLGDAFENEKRNARATRRRSR